MISRIKKARAGNYLLGMEELKQLPFGQLLQSIVPLLKDSETQLICADMVLERIREGIDSPKEVALLLQNIAILCSPSASLSQQILEICQIVDSPIYIIPLLSSLIRWPEDEEDLLELYTELLDSNRKLLIPIVDSLSSLPLSKSSRETLFKVSTNTKSTIT